MAKVISPYLNKISGTVADIATFGNIRGTDYFRSPGPRGTRGITFNQKRARALFSLSGKLFASLSEAEKQEYKAEAESLGLVSRNVYHQHLYDNLVLWLKCYEGTGAIAHDISPRSNNADLTNTTWTDGIADKALYFNGIDASGMILHTPELNITEKITLAGWANPETIINDHHIIRKGISFTPGNSGQYILRIRESKPEFSINQEGFVTVIGNVLEADKWYDIIGTFDGIDLKIYVGGNLENTTNSPGTISANANPDLYIGSDNGIEDWFHGTIDEPMILNRDLLQNEITGLHNYRKPWKE